MKCLPLSFTLRRRFRPHAAGGSLSRRWRAVLAPLFSPASQAPSRRLSSDLRLLRRLLRGSATPISSAACESDDLCGLCRDLFLRSLLWPSRAPISLRFLRRLLATPISSVARESDNLYGLRLFLRFRSPTPLTATVAASEAPPPRRNIAAVNVFPDVSFRDRGFWFLFFFFWKNFVFEFVGFWTLFLLDSGFFGGL